MMKKLSLSLIILILCNACSKEKNENELDHLTKTPKEVALELTDGYALNQFSNDTILPYIGVNGNQIITGQNQTFVAEKWNYENETSISEVELDTATEVKLKNNFIEIKNDPLTHWINSDSVKQFKLRTDTLNIIITSQGDTIETGTALILKPEIKKAIHTQPKQAGNLYVKDNAFHNLSYLDLKEGLSSSYIYSGLQDKRGDYWFATYGNGLIRFNGIQFTNYTTNEGLPDNFIRSIIEDEGGNIWIATDGHGLCQFDGNTFNTYSTENGFCSDVVYNLITDNDGNIWASTNDGGAAKFDGKHFTFYTKNEGLSSNRVFSILQTENGDYWFGSEASGIDRFDGDTFWHYSSENGLDNWIVLSIEEDKNQSIWLGTAGNGLIKLTRKEENIGFKSYAEINGISNLVTMSIFQDNQDKVWITTWGNGIFVYDLSNEKEGFLNISTDDGLSKDRIWFTLQDDNGDYWFGTEGGGLNKLTYPSFTEYSTNSGLNENTIWEVMVNSQGDLWFATFLDGLHQIPKCDKNSAINSFQNSNEFRSGLIRSITEDQEGNMWFASWEDGIYKYSYHQAKPTLQHFKNSNEGNSFGNIYSIFCASNGDIWCGTQKNGAIRIVATENGYEFYKYSDSNGLGSNKVFTITEDGKGNLWFGLYEGGLTCLTLKENNAYSTITYSEKEGLSSNTILTNYFDANGVLWLGTDGKGLMRFDGDQVQYYGIEDGLSSLKVHFIIADKKGNLWVGTDAGLNIIQALNDGHITITPYTDKDGLNGQNFFKNSAVVDQHNNLWAATGKGILFADLDAMRFNYSPPDVHLTGIELNSIYYDFNNLNDTNTLFSFSALERWTNIPLDLELHHTLNEVTFRYNAIHGGPRHKLKYQFKLEGNNPNWSAVTTENKVVYRSLNPGQYTFYVRAAGQSEIWSDTISYSFYIHPPWWKTSWAYLIYILIFITLLYLLYRYQLTRRLKIQEAEQEIELSKLKTQFFTNISHEFRTPLTLIKGVTDQLRGKVEGTEIEKEIAVLERNSDHLLNTVNQLLDLSKLDARKKLVQLEPVNIVSFIDQFGASYLDILERKNIAYSLNSSHPEIIIQTDKIALGQIIQNLIGNAVKFTTDGRIDIHVELTIDKLAIFSIEDTGIGISEDQLPHVFDRFYQADDKSSRRYEGTGIGLSLTKELVELLNGQITVRSVLGQGTSFIITFPNATNAAINESNLDANLPSDGEDLVIDQSTDTPDKPLLLIVEDHADVRNLIADLLKKDYQIITAENGDIGLELAIKNVPDFIVSDWMMPVMTGPQMIQELKSNKITSHIPIMLLTARADQASKLSGYKYGAEAYLAKPFEAEELRLQIKTLIQARNALRNYYSQENFVAISQKKPNEDPTIDDLFIEKTLELIFEKLDDSELNGEWLAAQHYLSRSQFARKLKAITSKSITAFIRDQRLGKAKELILANELNISEIAYAVGFSDPAYFTRTFTKEVGLAPSDYRG